MFPILFTFMALDWFTKGKTTNNNNENNQENNLESMTFLNINNLKFSNRMLDFITEYEDVRLTAYKVPGEKFYTIGIGSTKIYSNDGKSFRAVKQGEKISLAEAKKQMRIYYERPNSPKERLDAIIKQYGFRFNQNVYDMLLQLNYASGGIYIRVNYRSVVIDCFRKLDKNVNLNECSELVKNLWVNYLKIFADYSSYGLGWSRRAWGVSQYILNKPFNRLLAEKTIKVKY